MIEHDERRPGSGFVVYLCTGEVCVVPAARGLMLRDDRMVCIDQDGRQVAAFDTRKVYMCSRAPTPAEPRV
jgi:hypothetical protein